MAARATGSAHLTVVDAISESHHLWRGSLGNFRACGCARIGIRALGRLGGGCNDIAGRRRCARAGSELWVALGSAAIDDAVDASLDIVGNVKRPISSNGHAGGTMRGSFRRLHRSRKAVGENLALAGCPVAAERLKNYVVAALRVGSPVP